jgi:hypothetical protein
MRSTHATAAPSGIAGLFKGPEGSCGRVMLSWVTAGGIAGGGVLVGLLTVAGYVPPGLQLLAAPVLFIIGAFLGAVHGGILAVAGRPRSLSPGAAARRVLVTCLFAIPALGAAWVVTAGISLTAALVHEWRFTWGFLSLGGWVFGLTLCLWAGVEGWQAVRRAYDRWPEGRLATALTMAILLVASLGLVRIRPEIWGTDLRLNGFGSVILASALTLWVAFPLVCAVLRVVHGWLPRPAQGGEAGTYGQ